MKIKFKIIHVAAARPAIFRSTMCSLSSLDFQSLMKSMQSVITITEMRIPYVRGSKVMNERGV